MPRIGVLAGWSQSDPRHRAEVDAVLARLAQLGWREGLGLISYGPKYLDVYPRVAEYIDRILRGAKPANLPVEVPTNWELFINLNAAKALGLTIPETLLATADEGPAQKPSATPIRSLRRCCNVQELPAFKSR
jgi:hypothetical protein